MSTTNLDRQIEQLRKARELTTAIRTGLLHGGWPSGHPVCRTLDIAAANIAGHESALVAALMVRMPDPADGDVAEAAPEISQ